MRNQFRLLKIILGFSLILAAIGVITLSFLNNFKTDKAWLGIIVYPPALLYIYLLGKLFIEAKAGYESKGFEDFMMLSVIAMILPFGYILMSFSERNLTIETALSIYLVILWLINVFICFVERKESTA